MRASISWPPVRSSSNPCGPRPSPPCVPRAFPCTYEPLAEGYRAWAGGLGLAKHLAGAELDAAYEYLNWYLSGWVGRLLTRQGYDSAVLDTAKREYDSPMNGVTGSRARRHGTTSSVPTAR